MPSTTAAISFSGLASGIDTTSIIAGLTQFSNNAVTQVQATEATYQTQLAAWQGLNTAVSSLQSAAASLSSASLYNTQSGTSSNTAAATFTVTGNVAVGDHELTVNQLASAQKVVSKTFSSSNAALNESGTFTVNGKTVTVAASDSLATIAASINAASAGVQATVLNVGQNDYRLTLAGNATGSANAISAADNSAGTNDVLSDLGLLSSTSGIRDAITTADGDLGAGSLGLSSATQAVGTTLGAATGAAASGTVQIDGTSVAIDLNSDSLNDIANKINAAGISGVTAQVVTLDNPNATLTSVAQQQLQITSSSGTAPAFTDSNNVLSTLGVLQNSFTTQITSAADAKFNLDGIDITRPANVISDVITGGTIKLQSAGTTAAPSTTDLNISQDTSGALSAVSNFASAYNAVQDFITAQNTYTPSSTTATGAASDNSRTPLFGDSTLSSIQNQLSQSLSVAYGSTTLENIGISTNSSGDLTVNTSVLTNALETEPSSIQGLFALNGTATNSGVSYVGASANTKATTGSGYDVFVTKAATQTTIKSTGTQGTGVSDAAETLSFGGSLFSTPVSIVLPKGSAIQDTINQINGNSTLNTLISASADQAGHLVLSSIAFGSTTGFTVSSSTTGSISSGFSAGQATTAGVDVAGTINGEAATGVGQALTGNSGNATTDGLALLVTGSADNTDYGYVTVSHGIADNLNGLLTAITDPTSGDIAEAETSVNSQISNAQAQIKSLQAEASSYSQYLQTEFANMEEQINALKAQGSAFAATIGSSTSSSSSSSGTSSTNSSGG